MCVCCHDRLLRHLNRNRVYWFCPTCHQEMPNIEMFACSSLNRVVKSELRRPKLVSGGK